MTAAHLPSDIMKAMRALRNTKGISQSEQIRRALRTWLISQGANIDTVQQAAYKEKLRKEQKKRLKEKKQLKRNISHAASRAIQKLHKQDQSPHKDLIALIKKLTGRAPTPEEIDQKIHKLDIISSDFTTDIDSYVYNVVKIFSPELSTSFNTELFKDSQIFPVTVKQTNRL